MIKPKFCTEIFKRGENNDYFKSNRRNRWLSWHNWITRDKILELKFQINLTMKLTNQGEQIAIETYGNKEILVNSFKQGLEELILDELNPEIKSGNMQVNIEIINLEK